MDASHLMERAENALRTGQTENLFPVIARRALEKIAEEKEANRNAWAATGPEGRQHVATLRAVETFQALAEVAAAAWEAISNAVRPLLGVLEELTSYQQADFALAPPQQRETAAERERRLRAEQARMRANFRAAQQIHKPITIRSTLK